MRGQLTEASPDELASIYAKLTGKSPSDADVALLRRVRDALEIKNNDALLSVLVALQFYKSAYDETPIAIERATTSLLRQVERAADHARNSIGSYAETEAKKAVASAQHALTDAVSKGALAITKEATAAERAKSQERFLRTLWQCIAILCVVMLIVAAVARYHGYESGHTAGKSEGEQAGYQKGLTHGKMVGAPAAEEVGYKRGFDEGKAAGANDGYRRAKDEKAAANWANAPEGQRALELAKLGGVQMALDLAKTGALKKVAQCKEPGWTTEERDGSTICYPGAARDGLHYGWRLTLAPAPPGGQP